MESSSTRLLATTVYTGTSFRPDPPSVGGVAGTSLIVGVGMLDDDATPFSVSTSYPDWALAATQAATSGSYNSTVGIEYKITISTSSENPPRFNTAGNDYWRASTLRF